MASASRGLMAKNGGRNARAWTNRAAHVRGPSCSGSGLYSRSISQSGSAGNTVGESRRRVASELHRSPGCAPAGEPAIIARSRPDSVGQGAGPEYRRPPPRPERSQRRYPASTARGVRSEQPGVEQTQAGHRFRYCRISQRGQRVEAQVAEGPVGEQRVGGALWREQRRPARIASVSALTGPAGQAGQQRASSPPART